MLDSGTANHQVEAHKRDGHSGELEPACAFAPEDTREDEHEDRRSGSDQRAQAGTGQRSPGELGAYGDRIADNADQRELW